jgi:hypothetical protein
LSIDPLLTAAFLFIYGTRDDIQNLDWNIILLGPTLWYRDHIAWVYDDFIISYMYKKYFCFCFLTIVAMAPLIRTLYFYGTNLFSILSNLHLVGEVLESTKLGNLINKKIG